MTWYYADWSWVQRAIDTAVLIVLLGILVWAVVDVRRGRRAAHRRPLGGLHVLPRHASGTADLRHRRDGRHAA